MDKTPADQLEAALAVLAAVTDNAELHALNCPQCNGNFKCQSAEFWHREGIDAAAVVEALQQRARRAALATRSAPLLPKTGRAMTRRSVPA